MRERESKATFFAVLAILVGFFSALALILP